jgi:uncharacterized Zn finger protein (UPF0148 family)
MDNYKLLKRLLGHKECPNCFIPLKITGGIAYCSKCDFEYELKYKDSKRNRNEKNCVQYRKLEEYFEEDIE